MGYHFVVIKLSPLIKTFLQVSGQKVFYSWNLLPFRNVYEGMLTRQRERGRSKVGKGETFSTQQVQEAHDEYENETTLFVFRLKSLKQGQTRSLLTQAARHHAAQVSSWAVFRLSVLITRALCRCQFLCAFTVMLLQEGSYFP